MQDSDLQAIKEHNARVGADKAWETSWVRRFSITVMTYIIAALYMNYTSLNRPFLGAFVPSGGYLLSTLSLPMVKNFWLNNIFKD